VSLREEIDMLIHVLFLKDLIGVPMIVPASLPSWHNANLKVIT